jgi:dUTP pyrophosphatase
MKIKVTKLNENAILPTYGSTSAAGADLYNLPGEDVVIPPHKTVLIHTGLAMELPDGYAGFLFARSGIASKRGLAPANKVGVIDSDYRGEFMVALHNHSSEEQTVAGGERVAQLCILPVVQGEFILSDSLDETERGAGGFGSTGKQ